MEKGVWIARNKNGDLYIYKYKPTRYNNKWVSCYTEYISKLKNNFFPEVTFENSPQRLIIKQD